MLDRFGTNSTQLIGILAFAAATSACLLKAYRSKLYGASTWKMLALINGILLLEIFIGLRHRIHDLANTLLAARGLYSERRGMQEIVITSVAALALIFAIVLFSWRHTATGATRLAVGITIAVITLFAIETVSLHAVDAVLYRQFGSVMLIGWLWAISAVGICLAATRH